MTPRTSFVLALLVACACGAVYGDGAPAAVASPIPPVDSPYRPAVLTIPPVILNQLPGFGAGSAVQGDLLGLTVGSVLDAGALAMVGVLSFSALGGMPGLSTAAGIGALVFYGANRVFGLVRPIRFARQLTSQ